MSYMALGLPDDEGDATVSEREEAPQITGRNSDPMILYSEFDSSLLKRKVGRAAVRGLGRDLLTDLRLEQTELDLDLVLVRDDGFDFSAVHLLPWDGVRLSDVKLLSSTRLFPSRSPEKAGFYVTKEWRPEDVGLLKAMVSQIADLSQYGRFFGRAVALELYERWVVNSLSGEVADRCFLVRSERGDQPVGFVALKIEDEAAEATLLAVAEGSRGIGIGEFLISNVLFSLGETGADTCVVASQITNRSALRFFNSLGFKFDSYRVDFILYQANSNAECAGSHVGVRYGPCSIRW